MAKYNKIVTVEALTFEEFVEYGKTTATSTYNGMPWSFDYRGYPITHENDERYSICTPTEIISFTINDMVLVDENNKISVCDINSFNKIYRKISTHNEYYYE